MVYSSVKDKILNRKTADYSFIVVFFLLFSFFIIFAIKPNLETAFKLNKELSELKKIDITYNNVISQIVDTQSVLLQHRDDIALLHQALPDTPQLNKVVSDIQTAASTSGVLVDKLNVSTLDLSHQNNKTMKNYIVTLYTTSDFPSVKTFIDTFFTQRRLKLIKRAEIGKETQQSSDSGKLRVLLELEGYYL